MTLTCNFARVAIRHFTQEQMTKSCKLPKGSVTRAIRNYNNHFTETPAMQVTFSYASKHFTSISRRFNNRWTPPKARLDYLTQFGLKTWERLSMPEKVNHTLHDCKECDTQFPVLSAAFPGPKKVVRTPTIAFTKTDLSTPQRFGRKVLRELNTLTQSQFGKSFEDVVQTTPRSRLIKKPSSAERKAEKEKIQREVVSNLQQENAQVGQNIVLQHRISWRAFDKIRKTQGLEATPKRQRVTHDDEETLEPQPKWQRRHGRLRVDIVDQEKLLEEASAWSPEEDVNCSEFARKYGLNVANGDQVIKELLQEHNIPAASISQRKDRAPRRPRKKLNQSRVSFPMHHTVTFHRKLLNERIDSGDLVIGEKVVPSTYMRYSVNPDDLTINEEDREVNAQKISLLSIREKLLVEHDRLGLLQKPTDEEFACLTRNKIIARLQEFHGEFESDESTERLRDRLISFSRQCHIKMWHDHSSISGHGHFLVLISAIYDPAIYYTPEEMEATTGRKVDVQSLVELPEIHIIGRSTSSIEDQLKFNECRVESLADMANHLTTCRDTGRRCSAFLPR